MAGQLLASLQSTSCQTAQNTKLATRRAHRWSLQTDYHDTECSGRWYACARIHGTLVSQFQSHCSLFVAPRKLLVRYSALNGGGCKGFRCNQILRTLTHSPIFDVRGRFSSGSRTVEVSASTTVITRGGSASCLSGRVNGPTQPCRTTRVKDGGCQRVIDSERAKGRGGNRGWQMQPVRFVAAVLLSCNCS